MKTHSARVWLTDIRDEIAGIRSLTREADLAVFSTSWPMKRAVEHALLIIAEAAKNLPQRMKDGRPEVPWHNIMDLVICCGINIVMSVQKYCGQLSRRNRWRSLTEP